MPRPDFESTEYRVYGPPGTGKTTYIAREVATAAERFGPDQVSVCSLTNTAVREAVGRDLPISADNVTTLHARCKRSLGAGPPAETKIRQFLAEFPRFDSQIWFPKSMLQGAAADDEQAEVILATGAAGSVFDSMQIQRQQMAPESQWHPDERQLFAAWRAWCDAHDLYDFTGWLETTLRVDCLPAQQVLFVDEAQDHTPLQLAVIRSWRARTRVLVGDDDQAIYEWSGAIPDRFFEPALPPERETVLAQSFRVPRQVHALATDWVRQINHRRAKMYRPTDQEGSVTRLNYVAGLAALGILPTGLEDGDGTAMILASCGYMLAPILQALRDHRIAYHNPYRRANAQWNPLASVGEKLDAFLIGGRLWTGKEAETWAKVIGARAFEEGMQEKFLIRCAERGDEQLTREDLYFHFRREALELLSKRDLAFFERYRRPSSPGCWDYALDLYRHAGGRPDARVIVGTVHSVKGGEADRVFLFPDLSSAGLRDYLSGASGWDRTIRLFYVGMTRARKDLMLCAPDPRGVCVRW